MFDVLVRKDAASLLIGLTGKDARALPMKGCGDGVALALANGGVHLFRVGDGIKQSTPASKWISRCADGCQESKKALAKAFMCLHEVVFREATLIGEKISVDARCLKLVWEDVFPLEEMPVFEVVDRQVELLHSQLHVREKVSWEGLEQVHEYIFNTCMLSGGLIDSMLQSKSPALGVPHGFKVYSANTCILSRSFEEYDQGNISREDPYLGKTRKFGCVKCGISTFGLEVDRVCHECTGGKLSTTGGRKIAIIEEFDKLCNSEMTNETWRGLDAKARELFSEWKSTGYAANEERDLWPRFEKLTKAFFDKKEKYFEERHARSQKEVAYKESLIEKASILEGMDIPPFEMMSYLNGIIQDWRSQAKDCKKEIADDLNLRFRKIEARIKDKVKDFVLQQESEYEENRIKKRALILKAKEVSESGDFKNGGDLMASLMTDWRNIGKCGKKEDDELWDEFYSARQQFYTKREEFRSARSEEFRKRIDSKEAIILKAVALIECKDWHEGAKAHKELLEEWKSIGGCGGAEQDLWLRFNDARQVFYGAIPGLLDSARAEKIEIVERLNSLKSIEDQGEIFKEFSLLMSRWEKAGSAGENADDALWASFCKARFEVLGY